MIVDNLKSPLLPHHKHTITEWESGKVVPVEESEKGVLEGERFVKKAKDEIFYDQKRSERGIITDGVDRDSGGKLVHLLKMSPLALESF